MTSSFKFGQDLNTVIKNLSLDRTSDIDGVSHNFCTSNLYSVPTTYS